MQGREYIFLYGSLWLGTAERRIRSAVARLCRPVARGHIRAQLYDLGSYPGAVISDAKHARVHGQVYALHRSRIGLALLDRYEAYFPGREPDSEFVRRRTAVTLVPGGRIVEAWVYLYNGEVTRRPRIPGGDYRRYLGHRNRCSEYCYR